MVPSSLQLPPRGLEASAKVIGEPPFKAVRFNLLSAKNPMDWPSGEKKGPEPFSVPAITVPVFSFRSRGASICLPSGPRSGYNSRVPSGEMAVIEEA